ncbi:tyrosine-type recombinase/integrase [Cytobacillus pseudoceanisediminis]|uniref:tyrosine-type recombinase/integrase n=1 Tax=Cytobacillus pseudoceanisediminis TaxID=3051614 RepID=UPI003C2CB1A0
MTNYWELTKTFPNAKNQEVIGEYLLSLKLANRTERTILAYRWNLERFFRDKEKAYYALSSEEILESLQKNEAHVKESTYLKALHVLSAFYKFCVYESLMERSPIKRRWFPRVPKSVPKYLGKDDIAKLRQVSEKFSNRNQALVEFMLTSGCRVGEVHQLNCEDVDLENRIAQVSGKGNKIRYVHFTEKCAILLHRYLNQGRPSTSSSALFVNFKGKRLGIGMMYKIIREIGEKAGISTRMHPHRLRHTFATELLAKGAELSFIGEELGHSDIGTTQIYARLPKSEIVAQYRKYMG